MIGRHAHNAYTTCAEIARARAKKLRSVGRWLSNQAIREEGAELVRVRTRRATLFDNLQSLARAQEVAADNDWDEDPGRLMMAVDAILDEALIEFQAGRINQAIDLVVGATSTIDEALEAMGLPDSDEPETAGAAGGMMSASMTVFTKRSQEPMPDKVRERMSRVDPERLKVGYRSMGLSLRKAAVEAGSDPTKPPMMYGEFAVFNEWTEILDLWEGEFMERIEPGAFAGTFEQDRQDMRVLFQHGRDSELGSKVIGSIESLQETKTGAAYESQLFRGLPELLLEGLAHEQYGASFRFEVVDDDWDYKPKASAYNPRAIPERTLRELRVAEFGPVTFPAYKSASAALRSLTYAFVANAGRPRAGSMGGGVPASGLRVPAGIDPVQAMELQARDAAWQLRRPVPQRK